MACRRINCNVSDKQQNFTFGKISGFPRRIVMFSSLVLSS